MASHRLVRGRVSAPHLSRPFRPTEFTHPARWAGLRNYAPLAPNSPCVARSSEGPSAAGRHCHLDHRTSRSCWPSNRWNSSQREEWRRVQRRSPACIALIPPAGRWRGCRSATTATNYFGTDGIPNRDDEFLDLCEWVLATGSTLGAAKSTCSLDLNWVRIKADRITADKVANVTSLV